VKEDRPSRRSNQQFYPRPGGDAAGTTLNHRVRSGGPGCGVEAFLCTRIWVVLEMVLPWSTPSRFSTAAADSFFPSALSSSCLAP
jgi:hypothetical protein